MMFRTIWIMCFASTTLSFSCSSKRFECSDVQKGNWAIELTVDQGSDGGCPYEGTATMDGESHQFECEVSGDRCLCSAGSAFGVYEVTFTNTEEGTTDFGVLEVDPAPTPICNVLDPVQSFERIAGMGGQGGAGGAP